MASKLVEDTRIKTLNKRDARDGDYVLYWMQQSQRAAHNPALEYVIQKANARDQPLLVCFGLMDDYPHANLRHYRFMLEGLAETQRALERRGIALVVRRGQPADVAIAWARSASLIVCDRGYLRHQKAWRQRVASEAECAVIQVEADVVVPVEVASNKAEYAARTLRPKINARRDDYLTELATTPLKHRSSG
jgi:deoxyribodipyrimidine photo-lyase